MKIRQNVGQTGLAKAVAVTIASGAVCGALLAFPWTARWEAAAPLTLFPLFSVYRSGRRLPCAALTALFTMAELLVGLQWIYGGAVAHQGAGDYYTSAIALLFECIPYALMGWLASWLSELPETQWCVAIAGLWTLCEYSRSASPLGVPYLQMGHALIDTPLVGLARFAGTESLTFLSVLVSTALFALSRRPRNVRIVAWIVGLAAIAVNGATFAPSRAVAGRRADVAVFQLGQVASTLGAYIAAMRIMPQVRGFAIWPESNLDLTHGSALRAIASAVRARGVPLLVGGTLSDATGTHDALVLLGRDGRFESYYAKRHLVPFGEFLPFASLAHVIIPTPLVDQVPNLTSGTGPITFRISGYTVGPLICYESAFPALARDEVRRGANLLVAATNDAWFTQGSGLWELAQSARLVAIETGTPMILAGSVGPSGAIDADGRWTGSLPIGIAARAVFAPSAARATVYDRFGDVPVVVILGVLVLLVAIGPLRTIIVHPLSGRAHDPVRSDGAARS